MLSKLLRKQQAYQVLEPYLPSDHAEQMTAERLAQESLPASAVSVLDLGCGTGSSLDVFRDIGNDRGVEIVWRGVDIEDSPEVRSRTRTDGIFDGYDGIHLPYDDKTFDVVYSDQVFEHVRHPDLLVKEVMRVLRVGGLFLGSVSYLEPYHSYSIFNFTPYGVIRVLEDAGLRVQTLRPCVDGLTLIWRQLLLRPKIFDYFVTRVSPMNLMVSLVAWMFRLDKKSCNYLKVQISGQICFVAQRA